MYTLDSKTKSIDGTSIISAHNESKDPDVDFSRQKLFSPTLVKKISWLAILVGDGVAKSKSERCPSTLFSSVSSESYSLLLASIVRPSRKSILVKSIFTLLGLGLHVTTISAQERSASGSVDLQMTWTALNSLAQTAMVKSDMVDARVDQVVACNRKAMLYAPGAGADGDGCIENSKITALAQRIDAINTQIATINDQINSLNNRMGKAEERLVVIANTLSTQAGQIRDLFNKNEELSKQFADLQNRTNELYGHVNHLSSLLNDYANKLNGINGRIANINNNISTINNQIGDLYNRSNDLYNRSRSGARWYHVGPSYDYRWTRANGFSHECSGTQGVIGRLCNSPSDRCHKYASAEWRNESNDSSHFGTTQWEELFACE